MVKFHSKFIFICLIIFLALLGLLKFGSNLTWSIHSVTVPKEEAFKVSAEGIVYTQPDMAEIVLGVQHEASTVQKTQELINRVNKKLIEHLVNLGIAKEKIKTTNYQINPRYEWDRESGERRLASYQGAVDLLVKINDFAKLDKVVDQAVKQGANQIKQISFKVEDEDGAKSEARNQAISKAKDKAKEIARVSGLSLGKLINVQVQENNYYSVPRAMYAGGGEIAEESIGTQLEPGENKISVTVILSYEIK